jgi:hypothetical protein
VVECGPPVAEGYSQASRSFAVSAITPDGRRQIQRRTWDKGRPRGYSLSTAPFDGESLVGREEELGIACARLPPSPVASLLTAKRNICTDVVVRYPTVSPVGHR